VIQTSVPVAERELPPMRLVCPNPGCREAHWTSECPQGLLDPAPMPLAVRTAGRTFYAGGS